MAAANFYFVTSSVVYFPIKYKLSDQTQPYGSNILVFYYLLRCVSAVQSAIFK